MTPGPRRVPRGCAVVSRGGWGERGPIFQQPLGMWRGGANVPQAPSVGFRGVALRVCGWNRKVPPCCWPLMRLGIILAHCTGDDLEPSRPRRVPASQQEAVERGKIRRQARSRKKRSVWLADLAKRSWNAP